MGLTKCVSMVRMSHVQNDTPARASRMTEPELNRLADLVADRVINSMVLARVAEIEPEYLTRQQAARLLGVSPGTVGRMVNSRDLPTVRIGKCVRIPRESVMRAAINQKAL